ncbi:hypothetical protein [Paraburkholderia sp. BCC1886]|uniref:hypothetical protein n=1 Tax=Paraburkholderia sp. BCC1886 TaxID=2562670 RepID=UPI001182C0A9|nr:hypothetical protein [Paraburkholderia sp. BCC1886]
MTKRISETKTYAGKLIERDHEEASDLLFIESLDEPLAEVLERDIAGKFVSVRYWITDKEVAREEAEIAFVHKLMGFANCDFGAHYSEATGYLWTDEDVMIGGHDLLNELRTYKGEWVILEIDIMEAAAQ